MFLTIDDIDLSGKKVLLRADLNVPMKEGLITDSTRLERLVPTLNALKKSIVIVMSHFGRPEGIKNDKYSLRPIVDQLSIIMQKKIKFIDDCVGEKVEEEIQKLTVGDIVVLENTRFHPEEEENDPIFSKKLAALGDVFVADAFSVAHRAHASTEGVGHFIPTYAGKLMKQELMALTQALEAPQHPVMAIVGGSKISTKLDLLNNLIEKVDYLVLGGGMANTFIAANAISVGASLYEKEMLETAREIQNKAQKQGCKIILPIDVIVAKKCSPDEEVRSVDINEIEANDLALDIGTKTINKIINIISDCKTIVWNGPLGVFEIPPFDRGTKALAEKVAERTKEKALLSVAGGGDTVSALNQAKVANQLSYMSTAGGAFLEWLEGKNLPGVAIIKKKESPNLR